MEKTTPQPKSENEPKTQRPSLRTVAEHVDLSPTAVALALRGDESIPPETRQRVTLAAEELNYEYIPRARRSTPKRLRRLSYVMPDFGDRPLTANPFYGHLLVDAEQACQTRHASLNFVVLQRAHPLTVELPPALTHDLDGILLASPYPVSLINRVHKESACPIVLLDHFVPDFSYDSVLNNDFYGARQATEHLIGLGHTRIIALTGKSRNYDFPNSYKERYRGYCEACTVSNLKVFPPAIVPEDIDERGVLNPAGHPHEEYKAWLKNLLENAPDTTAFFCVGDYFALGLVTTLQEWGYRVPEDFSVAGFDNFEMSSNATPPLTTVHSNSKAMAQVAVQRLLERIDGDDNPPQNITIRTHLVIRASTGPVHEKR